MTQALLRHLRQTYVLPVMDSNENSELNTAAERRGTMINLPAQARTPQQGTKMRRGTRLRYL